MKSDELFKQFVKTKSFKEYVRDNNIPEEKYEGYSALVDLPSDDPLIQSLKEIAKNYNEYSDDKMYQTLYDNLLKI